MLWICPPSVRSTVLWWSSPVVTEWSQTYCHSSFRPPAAAALPDRCSSTSPECSHTGARSRAPPCCTGPCLQTHRKRIIAHTQTGGGKNEMCSCRAWIKSVRSVSVAVSVGLWIKQKNKLSLWWNSISCTCLIACINVRKVKKKYQTIVYPLLWSLITSYQSICEQKGFSLC